MVVRERVGRERCSEPLQEWPLGPLDAKEEPLDVGPGETPSGQAERLGSSQQDVAGEVAGPGTGIAGPTSLLPPEGQDVAEALGVQLDQVLSPGKVGVLLKMAEQTPMQSSQPTTFWKVLQEDGKNVDPLGDGGGGTQVQVKNSAVGGNEPEATSRSGRGRTQEKVPVTAELREEGGVTRSRRGVEPHTGGEESVCLCPATMLRACMSSLCQKVFSAIEQDSKEPLQEWPLGPLDAKEEPLDVGPGETPSGQAERLGSSQQDVAGEVAGPGTGIAGPTQLLPPEGQDVAEAELTKALGVQVDQVLSPGKVGVLLEMTEQTPMPSGQPTTFWRILQEDGENVDPLGDGEGTQVQVKNSAVGGNEPEATSRRGRGRTREKVPVTAELWEEGGVTRSRRGVEPQTGGEESVLQLLPWKEG
ncbi:hypothetical protein lerEdw1_011203 [Lerista edwardsae]|nr:hypothetical protein lerEdw1_011203 [Lerista edwardsae]